MIRYLILFIFFMLFSCGEKQKTQSNQSKELAHYPQGILSTWGPLAFEFENHQVDSEEMNTRFSGSFVSLDPSVAGEYLWKDSRTLLFLPTEAMHPDTEYKGLLKMPQGGEFNFSFTTLKQDAEIRNLHHIALDGGTGDSVTLQFEVHTADQIDTTLLRESLTLQFQNRKIPVFYKGTESLVHSFSTSSIRRGEDSDTLRLKLAGEKLNLKKDLESELILPSRNDFSLVSHQLLSNGQNTVELRFTDLLDPAQNLHGLIRIPGQNNPSTQIEGNLLRIFLRGSLTGNLELRVSQSLKNTNGKKLKEALQIVLQFSAPLPEIKNLGKGVILPPTEGLIYPFKAVSLNAIDMEIIQIPTKNLPSFYQINAIDEDKQLVRYGRPIFNKKINLNQSKLFDPFEENQYSIKLDDYIKVTPGNLYRVLLKYTPRDVAYPCPDTAHYPVSEPKTKNWDGPEEYSYWDSYENYYSQGYDWGERENPCHATFYMKNNGVERNLLGTDLGIIAKKNDNSTIDFWVRSIATTQAIANASLQVLNYQMMPIGEGKTSSEGHAKISIQGQAYLVKVETEQDVSFLSLSKNKAINTSQFETGGSKIQEGLQGWLYGEREVWRPGDTLHLHFFLLDHNGLDLNHPASFKLINPQGQVVYQKQKVEKIHDIYQLKIPTKEEDITGNYRSEMTIGGSKFTKNLRIETIKPNRLKIRIEGLEEVLDRYTQNGRIQSEWLHGAPASGLNYSIDGTLQSTTPPFQIPQGFLFTDPTRSFNSESYNLANGSLNPDGFADFSFQVRPEYDAPGFLKLALRSQVYEEGGDFSVDRYSLPYSPYEKYVGIRVPEGDKRGMLLTDTLHKVRFVLFDKHGNKINRGKLDVKMYKLRWSWWWEKDANNAHHFLYHSNALPLLENEVKINNGSGVMDLKLKYPEWGRYLIRACEPDGHCTGKVFYMDWPSWAGKAKRDFPGAATLYTFSADQQEYSVGEDIKLSLPGTGEEVALITLENGTKVLHSEWRELTEGENMVAIPTTSEMTPNLYVHLTVLKAHNLKKSDLPTRRYGIIPIKITNPSTLLEPSLKVPESIEPGQEMTITVNEKNGRAMNYTVAVVDEGLLSLTRFKTPDPHNHFYSKQALGVQTFDLYSQLLGGIEGSLEKISATGGDEEASGKESKKTNRFKPVVKVFGPFKLEPGENKIHRFRMPQYLGEVRTMVVAQQDKSFGNAEAATKVKQPVMVVGTLPRKLTVGSKIRVAANVWLYDLKNPNVSVKVSTKGDLKIIGKQKQSLKFEKIGDQVAWFELEAGLDTGKVEVELIARAGEKTSNYNIEVELINPNPREQWSETVFIEAGQTKNIQPLLIGPEKHRELHAEISRFPAINLKNRLKSLLVYPHGCVEQTTSKVFPQLYLKTWAKLQGTQLQEQKKNIQSGIQRIASMQTNSGGLGYWPGASTPSNWGTNYAGHFMIAAEKEGFNLPAGFKSKWVQYQQSQSRSWMRESQTNDMEQAYRLFVLALAGEPETGAMNQLREKENLTVLSHYLLAASYQLIGQAKAAEELTLRPANTRAKYENPGNTWGSHTRDNALQLLAWSYLQKVQNGKEIVDLLSEKLRSKKWMSTQELALSLAALSHFYDSSMSEKINGSLVWNGQSTNLRSEDKILSHPLDNTGKGEVRFSNQGKGGVWLTVQSSGQIINQPVQRKREHLAMQVHYSDKNGSPVNPEFLNQGQEILVEVRVQNTWGEAVENLALSQIFPSGWEIINQRLDATNVSVRPEDIDYMDIRDDRIHYYFPLKQNEEKVFRTLIQASYPGRYFYPATKVEAMYQGQINAQETGFWTEVKQN